MSFWNDDAFDKHPVWGKVDQLEDLLDDERLPNELDAPQRLSLVRLKTALTLLREHQERGVKVHYTKSMLDNVDAQLAGQVISPLSNFVSNPDTYGNSVNDASDHVETVFAYVAQWPSLPAGGQASAAGRAFSDYKREAEVALDTLEEKKQELSTEIQQLKSQLASLETQMSSVESRYTTAFEARDSDYLDAIQRVEASGKEAYDKAIEDDLDTRKATLDSLALQARNAVAQAKAHRDEAKNLAESSKDSADFLAQRAIATDFGENARRKSAAAWTYDLLGAAVIGTPLVFVLIHFLRTDGSANGTVAVSLTRLSIIVGAVLLGGYLFSRGATNHRQARASKSADIRLRTYEAFISKLTPEEQDEIRMGMARNIYLHGRLADDEPDSPNPFIRILGRGDGKDDERDEDKSA
ncbi:hypothetical protein [Mycobacterium intracellulare]|uniref:hypothetical protein n=1 Tax=Mycobacterium intracellulare TaxID=1767 RepID=UPI001915A71C|nr:hypothetical protein [Mycobacterium intracellulare]BCP31486.1 hypothetical protein MINTM026_24560 [Mycobacterium intracellulare]